MRVSVFVVLGGLALGCGGSTEGGGTGGGGGSGGSGGSGGAGGSGGSGGAGGWQACFAENGSLAAYELKTCTGTTACTMIVHQLDCCGNTQLMGIESSHLKAAEACEKAWREKLGPQCKCPAGLPKTEQPDVEVSDPSAAQVGCINWTATSGVCMTEPKK